MSLHFRNITGNQIRPTLSSRFLHMIHILAAAFQVSRKILEPKKQGPAEIETSLFGIRFLLHIIPELIIY